MTLNEQLHARRAELLRKAFANIVPDGDPVETLAEFLHQQYRAAAKAMARAGS